MKLGEIGRIPSLGAPGPRRKFEIDMQGGHSSHGCIEKKHALRTLADSWSKIEEGIYTAGLRHLLSETWPQDRHKAVKTGRTIEMRCVWKRRSVKCVMVTRQGRGSEGRQRKNPHGFMRSRIPVSFDILHP